MDRLRCWKEIGRKIGECASHETMYWARTDQCWPRLKSSYLVDRACPMYDSMSTYYIDERAHVDCWLQEAKEKSRNGFCIVDEQRKLEESMSALRSQGSRYDPREDPQGTLLIGEVLAGRGQIARAARQTWQRLYHTQLAAESFFHILDGSARSMKNQLSGQLLKVTEARILHCAHVAALEARRWAERRWKKTRGLFMCMLWWMRPAPTRPPVLPMNETA